MNLKDGIGLKNPLKSKSDSFVIELNFGILKNVGDRFGLCASPCATVMKNYYRG